MRNVFRSTGMPPAERTGSRYAGDMPNNCHAKDSYA